MMYFLINNLTSSVTGIGVKKVNGGPGKLEMLFSGEVVAKQHRYVYVHTGNKSQQDVLFGNLGVQDITGPVLEITHYYLFGLIMAGSSHIAPLKVEDRFKYIGQEQVYHNNLKNESPGDAYRALIDINRNINLNYPSLGPILYTTV